MANSTTPQTAKYFFIASKLKTKDKNFLVFDIQSANPNPGAPIDAYQLKSTGNENQLWQWGPGDAKDGRLLLSKMNGFAVDILNAGTDAGTPLDAFPVKTSDTANQLWTLTRDGHLVSQLNNLVIEIPSDADLSAAPVLAMNTQGSGLNQQWSIIPDYPLEDILRMKGDGFPSFTGGQETAFEAINKQLGVKNIRAEYVNTNKAISKALLEGLQRPANIQPDDWNKVIAQLGQEFQAVADVRALFGNFLNFYTELTVDQQARLNQAAVDADMDTSTTVNYSWVGLVESIIIGLLSLITAPIGGGALTIGVAASAAASILSGAVNMGLANNAFSGSTLNFNSQLSALWSQLSVNFETLLTSIAGQQNNILTNWNKLQAVEARINASGPTALKWNQEANARLIATSGASYTIFTLQQLLPTRFQIYRWSQVNSSSRLNDGFPTDAPGYATWSEQFDNGMSNYYTIQDSKGDFPGGQAMTEDLWNNGVQPSDFFKAVNGWEQFQIIEQALKHISLAINFVNQTGTALTVNAEPGSSDSSTLRGNNPAVLNPYWNMLSVVDAKVSELENSTIQFDYQLFEPNNSDAVISFTVNMDQFGHVSITSTQTSSNYFFQTSQIINANEVNDTPGSLTFTIWQ